ncbi:MAG: hypothetical protein RLZZ08_1458 [Pseudomonadota bacterium]
MAQVPLRLMLELRLGDRPEGTRVRPAVMAISELPPLDLPLQATGEAFVQAGYVGGDFSTPFIDGQLRMERPLLHVSSAYLRAGSGAWGGAQRGSARLDVGPTAALHLPLGPVRGRLAVDYRFRIAGEAAPASGPTVTLSAGF